MNKTVKDFQDMPIKDVIESLKSDLGNASIEIYDNASNGIPVGIKDIHCTLDKTTTLASRMLKDFVPNYKSTVVKKLEDNGYSIVCHTNMDEFAMGSTTQTSYYGSVDNAYDNTKIPGGSSGGSAYLVGKGLLPICTGTDTGGSVRQPAAYNGVYGMKPTYGVISRYGTISFASSFDTVGIISSGIEDNAAMLKALSGTDEFDQTSYTPNNFNPLATINEPVKNFTVGVMKSWLDSDIDEEIRNAINVQIANFEKLGATIKYIDVPLTKYNYELYITLAYAEATSNLSRYDGIKFGENTYGKDGEIYKIARDSFGDEVRRRLIIGSWATSNENSKKYYVHAQKIRKLMEIEFDKHYKDCQIIIGPTTPDFPISKETCVDSTNSLLSDEFTITANLVGMPSMSIPVGYNKDGLPIGMQIMADKYNEHLIYQAAKSLEEFND